MGVDTDYRYERKFSISNQDKGLVELYIKNHPANFKKFYPKRIVNNIYLDFPGMNSFDENIEGLADRKKVRIRWYGENQLNLINPYLEFKYKKGLVGHKQSYKLKSFNVKNSCFLSFIQNNFKKSLIPNYVYEDLKFYNLTIMNSYSRDYYISFDNNYRITLDTDVSYTAIKNNNNNFRQKYIKRNEIIMEIKYKEAYDKNSEKISNFFPFRLSKNSKYIEGIKEINKFI